MTHRVARTGQLATASAVGIAAGIGITAGWFGLGSLLDGFGGFALIGALGVFIGLGLTFAAAFVAFDVVTVRDRERTPRRGTPRKAWRSPTDSRADVRGEERYFRQRWGAARRRAQPQGEVTALSAFGTSMVLGSAAFVVWFVLDRGIA